MKIRFVKLCLAFLLASCSTVPPEHGNVRAHLYEYLHEFGGETTEYGAYSYVLGEPSTRLDRIRQEIVTSTAQSGSFVGSNRGRYNVFQIPNTVDLGKQILAALDAATPTCRFSRRGPYIVTLHQPLTSTDDDVQQLLFVDLTDLNEALIPELLEAYKNVIVDKGVASGKFQPFNITAINALLDLNDAIVYALIAVKDFKERWAELRKA